MARRRSSRRRSSRRRSPRRRTRRKSSRRSSRRRSGSRRASRKRGSGRLRWEHVSARLVRKGDPLIRGRIRLDRGSGVIEYPTPSQFQKIARQEGVPAEKVQRAFGHLLRRRRRTSKKKRASRKKRRKPLGLGALFGFG